MQGTVVTVRASHTDARTQKLHIVWECAAALLLTTGTLFLLGPSLMGDGFRLPVAAAGACACILTVGLRSFVPTRRFAALLPVCAALLLFLISPSSFLEELCRSANGLIVRWNVKYEDAAPLLGQGGVVSSVQNASIAFAILTGMAMWYAVERRAVVSVGVLSAVLLAAAQFFGYAQTVSVGLVLVGWLWLLLLWSCGGALNVHVLWVTASALLVVLFAFVIPDDAADGVAKLDAVLLKSVEHFRYGEDALPQGSLNDAADMHAETSPALSVHAEDAGTMYLRGFTGGRYADGAWDELPKSAYRGEKEGMFAWLSDKGFSPQSQYGEYLSAEETEESTEMTVSVLNTGADRRYQYIPYTYMPEDGISADEGDASYAAAGLRGSASYSFGGSKTDLPSELLHIDAWVMAPRTEGQQSYLEAEKVYRTFVYENYLETDEASEELIRELFWPSGTQWDAEENEFTLYEATDHIRTVLESTVQYTDTPAQLPDGAEPVRWFLTEAKCANAPYFATVSVLAYRMAGFPARYAEGYLLKEEAFSEDGNAKLTSQDGHAWAEVYLDGVSWLPVDTTPGYYYDAYSLQQMLTRPEDDAQTAQLDREGEDEAQEAVGSEGVTGAENDSVGKMRFTLRTAAGILTLLLLGLLTVFVFVWITRIIRWIRFRKSYRAASLEERPALLFARIAALVRTFGIECRLGSGENKTDAAVASRLSGIKAGEYRRVHRLAEKAVYGQTVLAPYELRVMERFYEKLISERYGKGRRTRFGTAARQKTQ